MKLDARPKILQIVEIIQAMAVVFVALSVVGWAAFYVLTCDSRPGMHIASYFVLGAAGFLLILAVALGLKIGNILTQGRKPLADAIISAIMIIFVTSSIIVVGQFALDNWSNRLKDCHAAAVPSK